MEPHIAKEIAKLDYIAIKNNAPFDIGCAPEDRGNPEKLKRHLMVNSVPVFIPAGEFFVDRSGVGKKLKSRGSTIPVYADEAEIKACALIKPSTYVFENETQKEDGSWVKSGKVIGFREATQVLSVATEEYYIASKQMGGGVASAKRIAKLESDAAEALKVKSELEKAKAEREAMLQERAAMLQQIAELKAHQALSGSKKGGKGNFFGSAE